jgi:GT2 family glycosyltransferase
VSTPDVSVVVLAHGDEPLLQQCVASVLASTAADGTPLALELVLVDNGSSEVGSVPSDPRVRVLDMHGNSGFAGGCNAGADAARGDVLVFLNSDAVVREDAVAALVGAVAVPAVGLACGSVRLFDQPDVVNAVGNPVHFLGLVWSGGYGEPAARHDQPRDVTSVTGAFFAVRRSTWEQLGGFYAPYFAYHEDVELSLRVWHHGLRVRYEPTAVALHDYAFTGNPQKHYLLERNRWITLLTTYPSGVLAVVLPALLVAELALCARALKEGWLRQKIASYLWLLRHGRQLSARRAQLYADGQVIGAVRFAEMLEPRLAPAVLGDVPGLGAVNGLLSAYWWLARRALRGLERSPAG